jgi:hypothetical protein
MANETITTGNGMNLYEFRLKTQDEKLIEIFLKLDDILPSLAVHTEQISSLQSWRLWATGMGGSMILALAGMVLEHVSK